MPELIYHFENANDMYKKYEYKLEYFKEFSQEPRRYIRPCL